MYLENHLFSDSIVLLLTSWQGSYTQNVEYVCFDHGFVTVEFCWRCRDNFSGKLPKNHLAIHFHVSPLLSALIHHWVHLFLYVPCRANTLFIRNRMHRVIKTNICQNPPSAKTTRVSRYSHLNPHLKCPREAKESKDLWCPVSARSRVQEMSENLWSNQEMMFGQTETSWIIMVHHKFREHGVQINFL